MTNGAIICTVVVSLLGVIGIWIKAYFDYRKKKSGNNPHPCAQHGERLARLEEGQENIEKQLDRLISGAP